MIKGTVAWILSMAYTKKHGGGGGTNDYNSLDNRPKINGTTLSGDKSADDLDLMAEGDALTNDQMSALLGLL
jgi:hypothetical protein